MIGRLSLYWYFFDPSYLFLTGGYANVLSSTRRVGVFVIPIAILLPIGLNQLITARRTRADLILLSGLVTAPFAACLVVPEPFAIDRELELLRPRLIVAVGGLAARRLLGPLSLFQCVGVRYERDGRAVVPLPHPSGASGWLNAPANRERLTSALDLVHAELARLSPC